MYYNSIESAYSVITSYITEHRLRTYNAIEGHVTNMGNFASSSNDNKFFIQISIKCEEKSQWKERILRYLL